MVSAADPLGRNLGFLTNFRSLKYIEKHGKKSIKVYKVYSCQFHRYGTAGGHLHRFRCV
jgi:hypothetical protein